MFTLQRIPAQIDFLVAGLRMFFTIPQWVHFRTMLLSLLITPYKATVRGRMKALANGFSTHRTKHNEFLQLHEALLGKALKFYALLLVHLLYKAGARLHVIVDDSKTAKTGKHVQAAFHLFDHATKRFLWGQQFLAICLEYRGVVIPYAIELYRSKKDCLKRKVPFRKITQIAEDLLTSMPDFGVKEIFVLADCYYASKKLIGAVRAKGYQFVSFFRANRKLCHTGHAGRPTTVGAAAKHLFATRRKRWVTVGKGRFAAIRTLYRVPGVGIVPIIFSRKKGRKGVLAVFSTDPTLSTNDILSIYRIRWSIEVLFKQTKQHLGLVAYHHRDERAVRSHLQLTFMAYALLTHLFVTEQRAQGRRLTRKLLATFSVKEAQTRVRTMVATDTFDLLKEHHHNVDGRVIQDLKSHLLAA